MTFGKAGGHDFLICGTHTACLLIDEDLVNEGVALGHDFRLEGISFVLDFSWFQVGIPGGLE
jgi:hypothetical protein